MPPVPSRSRAHCPLFESRPDSLCRCRAVTSGVVPSLHEREHFCVPANHAACPTFRASSSGDQPISEDAYYQLWTPHLGAR